MDSIYIYKDKCYSLCNGDVKLNEALTLIPSMSETKKIEAIYHWNNAALKLQHILDSNESQVAINQNQMATDYQPSRSDSCPNNDENIGVQFGAPVSYSSPSQVSCDGPLDLPIMRKEQPPYSFIQQNMIDEIEPSVSITKKLIYLNTSQTTSQSRFWSHDENPEDERSSRGVSSQKRSSPVSVINTTQNDMKKNDLRLGMGLGIDISDSSQNEYSIYGHESNKNSNNFVMTETQDTFLFDDSTDRNPSTDHIKCAMNDTPNIDIHAVSDIPMIRSTHDGDSAELFSEGQRCNLFLIPDGDCQTFNPDTSSAVPEQIKGDSFSLQQLRNENPNHPIDNTIESGSSLQINETNNENSRAGTQTLPKDENSNKENTCNICGKSGFSTKGNLKRHLKTHTGDKPYECGLCNTRFTEKKSLKIHERKHTGEKPYKCEFCDKEFSQTCVLRTHIETHYEERKFECSQCHKKFRQRSQLNLHLKRHDGLKNLACSQCEFKFLTKGDLQRHFRKHTGERPFLCQVCGQKFTRQQSLNEHLNRHVGRKPHGCSQCGASFSNSSSLGKHAKIHQVQNESVQEVVPSIVIAQ